MPVSEEPSKKKIVKKIIKKAIKKEVVPVPPEEPKESKVPTFEQFCKFARQNWADKPHHPDLHCIGGSPACQFCDKELKPLSTLYEELKAK